MQRRDFLAAATAAALAPKTFAQKLLGEPSDLAKIFEGIELTDQYGKTFNPAELFKEKQALVLFGYGGCPMCENISQTVAAIQAALRKDNREVPIVVISVQPESDHYIEEKKDADGKVTEKNPMKQYVGSYYTQGVVQFQDDEFPERDKDGTRDMGEKAYEKGRTLPAEKRVLHVVCPKTNENSQELEKRIAKLTGTASGIDPRNQKQHSRDLTLFSQGKLIKPSDGKGAFKGVVFNPENQEFETSEALQKEQSARVLAEIQKLQKEQKEAQSKEPAKGR